MNTQNNAFKRAYELAVVENGYHEAIKICREILETDPNHHMARMLLANLLDDHGSKLEIAESKKHYMEAIRQQLTIDRNWWSEENPVRNLAIWEEKNGNTQNAELIYLINFSLSKQNESKQELLRLLNDRDKELAGVIEVLLSNY